MASAIHNTSLDSFVAHFCSLGQMSEPMPITYSTDKRKGIISEVWTGKVAAMDLAAHWSQLLADADALAVRRTLVDLRNCEIEFSGEQLFDLVRTVVEPGLNGRDWRSALLVGGSVHFGVSRQYQAFAQMYSKDAIFRDKDAALKWLLR
jgi:hypothetical protein